MGDDAFRNWTVSYRDTWPPGSEDPDVLLIYGLSDASGVPTWGLLERHGPGGPIEHIWDDRPKKPSVDELVAWIAPVAGDEGARALARVFAANRTYLVEVPAPAR